MSTPIRPRRSQEQPSASDAQPVDAASEPALCFWKNKVECVAGTPFHDGHEKELTASQPWWRLRDDIENAMGVHVRRATKANPQGTYLVGFRVDPINSTLGDQLTSNDVLQPGDCLTVKRQPVDADTLHQFNRAKCQSGTVSGKRDWSTMTEDERLDAVLNTGIQTYLGDVVAAQQRAREAAPPPEDTDATCRACGRHGHSERWCSHKQARGFVPLWRRRAPSGIPRHRLRPATESEYDHAFLTSDGQLVVDRDAPKKTL